MTLIYIALYFVCMLLTGMLLLSIDHEFFYEDEPIFLAMGMMFWPLTLICVMIYIASVFLIALVDTLYERFSDWYNREG